MSQAMSGVPRYERPREARESRSHTGGSAAVLASSPGVDRVYQYAWWSAPPPGTSPTIICLILSPYPYLRLVLRHRMGTDTDTDLLMGMGIRLGMDLCRSRLPCDRAGRRGANDVRMRLSRQYERRWRRRVDKLETLVRTVEVEERSGSAPGC
jgi:hypothetical protein